MKMNVFKRLRRLKKACKHTSEEDFANLFLDDKIIKRLKGYSRNGLDEKRRELIIWYTLERARQLYKTAEHLTAIESSRYGSTEAEAKISKARKDLRFITKSFPDDYEMKLSSDDDLLDLVRRLNNLEFDKDEEEFDEVSDVVTGPEIETMYGLTNLKTSGYKVLLTKLAEYLIKRERVRLGIEQENLDLDSVVDGLHEKIKSTGIQRDEGLSIFKNALISQIRLVQDDIIKTYNKMKKELDLLDIENFQSCVSELGLYKKLFKFTNNLIKYNPI